MILAQGDPLKYRALKTLAVRDYVLTLDNFVSKPSETPADQLSTKKPTK